MKELSGTNFLSRRLLNGSLKIMEGEKGGAFYAKYTFGANSGTGYIDLLLEYPDGAVVSVPLCKNVCREVSLEGNVIGEWSKPRHKEIAPALGPFEPPKVHAAGKGGGSKADYESFIKYERPDFKIPIEIIWKRICELWELLPISTCHEAIVLEDFYEALLEFGEAKAEENEIYKDEEGVYLTKLEIEGIANDLGFDFNTIRRMFENRNLWIKDKGSAGYQFSKKIEGKKKNFYKLRKVKGNEDISINTDYCMEYPKEQ